MSIFNEIIEQPPGLAIAYLEEFKADFKKLNLIEQKLIKDKLAKIKESVSSDDFIYLLNETYRINLDLKYISSLYILKVDTDLRVFLFYEDDPIFEQKIITLLRACHYSEMDTILLALINSFYGESVKILK